MMNSSDLREQIETPEESPLMDADLMGEKILNKKAVYEPSSSQRCRQLVCSRRWTVAILVTMGLFLVLIAIIAAFARPGSYLCQTLTGGQQNESAGTPSSPASKPAKDYVSTDGRAFPWHNILLPRDVVPDVYEIFLHPNISQSVFSGNVTISASVVKATDHFLFHIKELNVTEVSVRQGAQTIPVNDTMEYRKNEQFYVKLEQQLQEARTVTLVIHFQGALVNKLAGFYKSSYTTASGETREIATTHFEPTDARAAFPCFDEPDLKANFSLSIVREARHITLFNMPRRRTVSLEGALLRDDHEMSVKMSTYLVAFVVCDFKNISAYTKQNTLVRVFAPEDQINQAHYAVEVAVKVLNYYNDFFGVDYPLPKQDMIAIPDFAAGAMENWGLITYRMTSILYDPEKTSPGSKQWITTVIAHELAHQWFGNIVTMKWWDDLWLNEGFASFVEFIGANAAEPSFGMEEQFVTDTLQSALYLDGFATSHPIQVPVNNPAEINEIFDSISYDKGASLISMLQDFVGKDAFLKGLHDYLIDHAYGNARTADLWQSLQEASQLEEGLTVSSVMDTWTLQMGYPVISVRRDPNTGRLTLSQSRFLLSGDSGQPSKYNSSFNYVWKVPFTYKTKTNQNRRLLWLTDKEATLPMTLGDGDWIKGNLETRGYYRVNYEPELWRRLIDQLKQNMSVFSARDRAGLLDDAFALARAGLLSYDLVFELLAYLRQETAYVPLQTMFTEYRFIGERIYVTDVYPKFQKYILDLLSEQLSTLGWEQQEQHLNKLLQKSLLDFAISMNHKDCTQQAQRLFQDWTGIPDNLRALVYKVGVEHGDDDVWLSIYNNFSTSNVPTEKKQFLYALTHTTDPRRIQLFLRDSLDDRVVKSQDTGTVIASIASTKAGHLFAWHFLQQTWDTLLERYGVTSFILSSVVKRVVVPFDTQFEYNQVQNFFKGRELGSAKMAVQQSLETVQTHINWTAQNEDTIIHWFKTNVNDSQ